MAENVIDSLLSLYPIQFASDSTIKLLARWKQQPTVLFLNHCSFTRFLLFSLQLRQRFSLAHARCVIELLSFCFVVVFYLTIFFLSLYLFFLRSFSSFYFSYAEQRFDCVNGIVWWDIVDLARCTPHSRNKRTVQCAT